MTYDFLQIQKSLEEEMDAYRFQHTLGVMMISAALAMAHGMKDYQKAQMAGLLHDCAKHISPTEQLKLCRKYSIFVSETEELAPYLLHAKLGAYLAKNRYGIKDEGILQAICCHTTGKASMSLLEKILYVADYIEPSRNKAPRLPYLRKLAFANLDLCVYEILKDTVSYLKEHAGIIDEETQKAFDYYQDFIGKQ